MRRARRLRALWNWLPAFRAVAETEHLPTASEALMVSAASLSRTIRLLEDEIGTLLFDRVGRSLRLNSNGAVLLDAVRSGMRAIDEGVTIVVEPTWSGEVSLWGERAYATEFLLPLARQLQALHPSLRPSVQTTNAANVESRILRGQLDLAVLSLPAQHEQLSNELLFTVSFGIYCNHDHPLSKSSLVDIQDLLDQETFVITPESEDTKSIGRWPPEYRRNHVVQVQDAGMAVEACQQLDVLAVLPDVIVRGRLHRIAIEVIAPASLYVCYRKHVGQHPRTEVLISMLRTIVGEQGTD